MAKEELGVDGLDLFFKKSYYSFQMGMRKPSPEIFQFVLNDAGILPQETLFIDDALPNIEAAQKLHFKTHHLLPGENIETLPFALSQDQIWKQNQFETKNKQVIIQQRKPKICPY